MADPILDQLRKYWMIITFAVAIVATNAISTYRLGALEESVKQFLSGGARYSLQDHYRYADQQKTVDDRQNERLTILEQQVNRR